MSISCPVIGTRYGFIVTHYQYYASSWGLVEIWDSWAWTVYLVGAYCRYPRCSHTAVDFTSRFHSLVTISIVSIKFAKCHFDRSTSNFLPALPALTSLHLTAQPLPTYLRSIYMTAFCNFKQLLLLIQASKKIAYSQNQMMPCRPVRSRKRVLPLDEHSATRQKINKHNEPHF